MNSDFLFGMLSGAGLVVLLYCAAAAVFYFIDVASPYRPDWDQPHR